MENVENDGVNVGRDEVLAAILAIVPKAVTDAAIPEHIPAVIPATIAKAVAEAIQASSEFIVPRVMSTPRPNNSIMILEDSNGNEGEAEIVEDTIEMVSDSAVSRGVQAAMEVVELDEKEEIPPPGCSRHCINLGSKKLMAASLVTSGVFAGLSMLTPWTSHTQYTRLSGSLWSLLYFLISVSLVVLYCMKVCSEQTEDNASLWHYRVKINNQKVFYKKCIFQYIGGLVILSVWALSTLNFIIEGLVESKVSPSIVYATCMLTLGFVVIWGSLEIGSGTVNYLYQGKRGRILTFRRLMVSPNFSTRGKKLFEFDGEHEPLRIEV